jgi:hypothetical protein
MTETMFDRMTRAAGDALYGYCDPNDTPNTWPQAAEAIRAALEAIREPDEFVVSEGDGMDDGFDARASARAHWPAMIDAILSQSQEGK